MRHFCAASTYHSVDQNNRFRLLDEVELSIGLCKAGELTAYFDVKTLT